MTARRAFNASLCSTLLLALAWGCSAADSASGGGAYGGAGSGPVEGGNDESVIKPDGSMTDAGGLDLNPLCGKGPQVCIPDQPSECAGYQPPEAPGIAPNAGAGGVGGAGGEAGGGGVAASESGAGGAAGDSGSSGKGGQGDGGPANPPAPSFGCRVQRGADGVSAQCDVAGPGGVGAPCLTSADCQGGGERGALGCVGDASAGLCLPYCCRGNDSCGAGTYCAERPMRDASTNAGGAEPLLIPVCVPAANCDLSTPYPCPDGVQCACKADTACVVVRSDGTTTCATPGAGKVGEACPCAWGHVCSAVTNQCLKLCYTRGVDGCGTGKCQAASELPDGWGVCVGN